MLLQTGRATWVWWIGIGTVILFLYLVRSILPPFLIGAAIAFMLAPVVDSAEQQWRLPRGMVVGLIYLAFFGPLILAFVFFGPRFFHETRQLIVRSPLILAQLIEQIFGPGPYDLLGARAYPQFIASDLVDSVRSTLGTPMTALHLATSFVDFLLATFLTLIVSIYLLVDSRYINRMLIQLVPVPLRPEVVEVSGEIHRTLARYFRGELFLIALVASITFIGLELVFHLHYALPLAVATGVVEIVPFVGPIVAATVSTLFAMSQGGVPLATGVLIFYVILRQAEDQIVMPVVLGRAVEIHPLVVIFAVLSGGALAGVLGTLLAVPVAAAIKVILDAWLARSNTRLAPLGKPAASLGRIESTLPPKADE
jgi:predicted PurR-regulated permease PerM